MKMRPSDPPVSVLLAMILIIIIGFAAGLRGHPVFGATCCFSVAIAAYVPLAIRFIRRRRKNHVQPEE